MRFARRLRASALVQGLERLVEPRTETGPPAVLMERIMADRHLGPRDARRLAADLNLEANLRAIADLGRACGIPVIFCTLPANDADIAPFGQDAPPAEVRTRCERLLAEGEALAQSDPAAALRRLEAAAALHGGHARVHWLLGRCLAALGRDEAAATHYERARDLDPMPWRAPSSANAAVKRAAAASILCDLELEFRARSAGGAIGWTLMDDHVHPSLRGQALVAEAVIGAMARLPAGLSVPASAARSLPRWEEYARRLGANELDAYGVAHRVRTLFRLPFYARSNPAAVTRAEAACAQQEARMSPQVLAAVRLWQDPRAHAGGRQPITGIVGSALLQHGQFEAAERLLANARKCVPPHSAGYLHLSWELVVCRQRRQAACRPESLPLLGEIVERGSLLLRGSPSDPVQVDAYVGLAHELRGDHRAAIEHLRRAADQVDAMGGYEVLRALARALVATGDRPQAVSLLSRPFPDARLRQAAGRLLLEIGAAPRPAAPGR
jgi:tetratricopeptide (TPR) repeat protein